MPPIPNMVELVLLVVMVVVVALPEVVRDLQKRAHSPERTQKEERHGT